MIYFVHSRNTPNIGDLSACPADYFDFGKEGKDWVKRDIADDPGEYHGQDVIIGGGGLIGPCANWAIENIARVAPRKLIGWAIGTNEPVEDIYMGNQLAAIEYPKYLNQFDLLGIRDCQTGQYWVPCPSCMNNDFASYFFGNGEVMFYVHHECKAIPAQLGVKVLFNTSPICDVINVMKRREYVVTNTRHGAYWATLLGCKVIMYPSCTRHITLRHRPHYKRPGEVLTYADLEAAKTYPDALRECREANQKFYERVKKLLELP